MVICQLVATEYDGSYSQATAPIENPALAHCFFIIGYNNSSKHFMWTFLEQQIIGCGMNGSIGEVRIFMLRNAPNAEEILTSPDNYPQKEKLLRFVDSIACTCNPVVSPDGSNLDDAPLPRTNPYICSHPYSDIHDYQQDCNYMQGYCLWRQQGNQVCRFGYPKPLQPQTNLTSENGEVEILTARNDTLVNSYNPVQLSVWQGVVVHSIGKVQITTKIHEYISRQL